LARGLPVRPDWTLDLNHAATGVTSSPGGQRIAIASEGPSVSVAEFGQPSIRTINLTEPARHIAINAAGDALAVVSASRMLQVLALESSAFGRERARWDAPVCDACVFSRDGRFLWTVGTPSEDAADVHCYDARTSNAIGHRRFKPFVAGCGFVLTLHPQEDLLGLWACGGPDELWNYWLRLTAGGIELQHQPELDGWTPPAFNSRGDRFAALNGYDLAAFSFPECQNLYEAMTVPDEDDTWRESMSYLEPATGDRVLAATNDGRIFGVALEIGEMIAEVALEGHEPKPCHQVYTSLSKSDDQLCTDLHAFTAVGSGLILSVHTNGRASNRKDSILLWRAPLGM
jgi:hypothetical protein